MFRVAASLAAASAVKGTDFLETRPKAGSVAQVNATSKDKEMPSAMGMIPLDQLGAVSDFDFVF